MNEISAPPFHPYGVAHLVVLFLTIALPFALAPFARQSVRAERTIVAVLSGLLIANYFAYLFQVRHFGAVNWKQVLPLQLCDWALFVIIVALWTHRPRWFEVAYFWGIGGAVQALLTPNLPYGFPDFRFISFFLAHSVIVIGIIFLMLVHHFRPRPWSILRVFAWTELYFVVTYLADTYTGVNYGFLLHKPEAKTLLNLLSDNHPLYLFQMHLLALSFFIMLYMPFAVIDFIKSQRMEEEIA